MNIYRAGERTAQDLSGRRGAIPANPAAGLSDDRNSSREGIHDTPHDLDIYDMKAAKGEH